jgi:hypothetical protein
MERYLGQQDGLDDPALVTERVLDEVRRTFDGFDDDFLERVTRQVVADIWGDSILVTNFVPVLAMRRVREVVEQGVVPELEVVAELEVVSAHA